MNWTLKTIAIAMGALLVAQTAMADIYLHCPRGSNTRGCAKNANRQNANKVFDSENNAAGGYACPGDREMKGDNDHLKLHAGAYLYASWTVQHSCGENPNAHCNVVVQYMCDDENPHLRDGYLTGDLEPVDDDNPEYLYVTPASEGQNDDNTATIPVDGSLNIQGGQPTFNSEELTGVENAENQATFYAGGEVDGYIGQEFTYHETWDYYKRCGYTERNKGLFTADRNLNGETQRYTRQNNNGARHGLECSEERDYYPWWSPSPWRDIAILTNDLKWCDDYKDSQNVNPRYYCNMSEDNPATRNDPAPISQIRCAQRGGTWVEVPAYDIPAPECKLHPKMRDNHLGNSPDLDARGDAIPASYRWKIPEELAGRKCVLRVRYNISIGDYADGRGGEDSVDSGANCDQEYQLGEEVPEGQEHCAYNAINLGSAPLVGDPYISMESDPDSEMPALGMNINTNQIGRTFEDRAWIFEVHEMPAEDKTRCENVHTLTTTGKRGNIVQAYPAIEYNFCPMTLKMSENDCVHITWTGTDYNANRQGNNGAGWKYSDRFTMAQTAGPDMNYPLPFDQANLFPEDIERKLVYLDQDPDKCAEVVEDDGDNDDNQYENCGKMNMASATQSFRIFKAPPVGEYFYMCVRNNNFSNRSLKGMIVVFETLQYTTYVVAATAGVLAVGMASMIGFAYARPHSNVGKAFHSFVEGLPSLPCRRSRRDSALIGSPATTV